MNTELNNSVLIKELTDLINRGNAHATFEESVDGLPLEQFTITPPLLPYNIWQLAEHIRITQWDIVEFCINPKHQSPKWPEEYWVDANSTVTAAQWEDRLTQVKKDRQRFLDILKNPDSDLFKPLPHGSGQNLLREALLIADHTSYHTGEIIVLRRLLKSWE